MEPRFTQIPLRCFGLASSECICIALLCSIVIMSKTYKKFWRRKGMSLEKSVQPRRINHVGAVNKGENQVGASEQGFGGVCAIRL
ncbi:transmembrane protein, putative [Medicago truncatula]|uniref:Transmembrane protein, putative n=1 Tax=Medicago truncatula TaxID=3880 RepID=G7K8E8_MEDTR|nr:transmembrane protein, putative [Medicago truncatula]